MSENCPSPTALRAAKRTVYNVYGLSDVITRGPKNTHRNTLLQSLYSNSYLYVFLCHWLFFSEADDLPEAGTVTSFHCSASLCRHCRTKPVIGVPPLTGGVLSEKRIEVGPGKTDR